MSGLRSCCDSFFDEQTVSLAEYVGRMRDKYVTADSLAAGKASPHLEIFRSPDRVDEWMLSFLNCLKASR